MDRRTDRQTDIHTYRQILQQSNRCTSSTTDELPNSVSVVKVNVLLADIRDYHRMNAVYQTCKYMHALYDPSISPPTFFTVVPVFPKHPPARAAYQVAALPNWARVEIEMIAVTGDVDNIGPSKL